MINCFVKKNSELSRLEINEIYFFCKINNKTIAVTKDSKMELNGSLYSISTLLEKTSFFMRTHKSYIDSKVLMTWLIVLRLVIRYCVIRFLYYKKGEENG